ncbi:MAG: hypothetical protein HQM10_13650 [Candidatus Riflebacteria bacterium]|nr:hypothetical protein [Candidatus Riflebacteria bacterium]
MKYFALIVCLILDANFSILYAVTSEYSPSEISSTTMKETPAYRSPPQRTLVDGQISEVVLSGEDSDPAFSGIITLENVAASSTAKTSFLVHKYTLILICDKYGKARVGKIIHLKKGWKCSIAYDLPQEDSDNSDFLESSIPMPTASFKAKADLKIADNILAYAQ